jgi:RNA polymerase sigma-70 factor (ECF subfamily)
MSSFLKNDEELFALIKHNDSKALKELFNKYFISLCGFSYTYVKSVDLSEEVVSDIFFNIWLKRSTLEIKSNLKAYLYTATRNRSINYLAKEKRNWESLEVVDYESVSLENLPDEIINFKELESMVESIIQKLPPKRQLVFRLNRIDGLSYKEISEVLSISINTVQNHMVKAVEFISNQYPNLKSIFTLLVLLFLV